MQEDKVTTPRLFALLERQEYCCALTGRELTPETASLDHVMPVSRGGAHSMANLQVLHTDVNQSKRTMTQREFIDMCREVVAYADRQMEQRARA